MAGSPEHGARRTRGRWRGEESPPAELTGTGSREDSLPGPFQKPPRPCSAFRRTWLQRDAQIQARQERWGGLGSPSPGELGWADERAVGEPGWADGLSGSRAGLMSCGGAGLGTRGLACRGTAASAQALWPPAAPFPFLGRPLPAHGTGWSHARLSGPGRVSPCRLHVAGSPGHRGIRSRFDKPYRGSGTWLGPIRKAWLVTCLPREKRMPDQYSVGFRQVGKVAFRGLWSGRDPW